MDRNGMHGWINEGTPKNDVTATLKHFYQAYDVIFSTSPAKNKVLSG